MNTIDTLIQAVADRMPKTNRRMLVDFPKKEMEKAWSFVDTCCKVAEGINPGAITYDRSQVMKPEEVARYLIGANQSKPRIPTVFSEMKLIKLHFTHNSHEGKTAKETHLFLPYMQDDFLIINGKKLAVHKGIAARVFTRDTEVIQSTSSKDKTKTHVDVLLVNPNRVKIQCKRHIIVSLRSALDGEVYSPIFIVTAKAHDMSAKGKKKVESTLVLYLLAKYGLGALLERYGISRDDFSFVDRTPMEDSVYDYFLAKDIRHANGPVFYLRANRALLEESTIYRKVVAEVLYLLGNFGFHNRNEVFDTRGVLWKIMLGRITSKAGSNNEAIEKAEKHLMSADSFLDELSRVRFKTFGVDVADYYELTAYMFENIDDIIVNTVPQDLYNRKIDIVDTLFITAYAEMIFKNFYDGRQQPKLKDRLVARILKFRAHALEQASKRRGRGDARDSEVTIFQPTLYGTDWLSSVGVPKVRRGGGALQRFHPSMAVVESPVALAGKESGKTGFINPFLEIDFETGAVIRPPWAQDIDTLLEHLPQI